MGVKQRNISRNFAQLRIGEYRKISSYDEFKLLGTQISEKGEAVEKIAEDNNFHVFDARIKKFDKSNLFDPQVLLIGYVDYRFNKKLPHLQALYLKHDNNVFSEVKQIITDLQSQGCLTPSDAVFSDQKHPDLEQLESRLSYNGNQQIQERFYEIAKQVQERIVKDKIPEKEQGMYKARVFEQIVPGLESQVRYIGKNIAQEAKNGKFIVQLVPLELLFLGFPSHLQNTHKIPNVSIVPDRLK